MAHRVLVTDGDPTALRFIENILEKDGYQVFTASNGVEGLKKAREENPDLIVLDVMLPGLDGFELCHRLRTDPKTAPLPILILSAKSREVDIATGLKVGADDYLTKPADPSAVVNKVAGLLSQRGTHDNVSRNI